MSMVINYDLPTTYENYIFSWVFVIFIELLAFILEK